MRVTRYVVESIIFFNINMIRNCCYFKLRMFLDIFWKIMILFVCWKKELFYLCLNPVFYSIFLLKLFSIFLSYYFLYNHLSSFPLLHLLKKSLTLQSLFYFLSSFSSSLKPSSKLIFD